MARSDAFIRSAIERSNPNALRLALFQTTGDARFAAFGVEQSPMNGGSSSATVLRESDRAAMTELAVEHLRRPLRPPSPPAEPEARRLIEMFVGRPITDDELHLSLEQLAFTNAVEDLGRSLPMSAPLPPDFHVLVIGGGFGGVACAIFLARLNIPFTVVDRHPELGGTWLANSYPDVRVDIPTRYYQFTFEQNFPWTHQFAPGGEVKAYIDYVARKYGVAGKVRHGVEVRRAVWNEDAKAWDVACDRGGEALSIRANAIISAAGLFNRPHVPDLPGVDNFQGARFHTTAWPADLDLTGKRIAVVGTGSSGSQLIPKIAQTAGHVTVFQRSPNWVAPIAGYRDLVSEESQWLLDTAPYYSNWLSFSYHWHSTQDLPGLQLHDPEWQATGGLINRRNDRLREHLIGYIRGKLGDREDLIAKCIPDHAPWTRRLVRDNGWYEALLRPNVTLVAAGIDHVEAGAVVDSEGARHPVDMIALSTGFATEQYLWPVEYVGRGGVTLGEAWAADGARAYLGMATPGFPNLFMLYGPNGQPRSGSITKWLEVWARYAVQAIAVMLSEGHGSVEVSRDAFDAYNAEMDQEMRHLIWESAGRSSYYVNSHGRSSVNMPWSAEYYYSLVKAFDPSLYIFD